MNRQELRFVILTLALVFILLSALTYVTTDFLGLNG